MTALERLDAWFKDQRDNHGLISFSVFPGDDATPESVAAEFLRWVDPETPGRDITHEVL